jgi:hypothetical protein
MQDCAKQCLGLKPVDWPSVFRKEPVCYQQQVARALKRDYFWDPSFYQNTWFFDALTIDPSLLLTNETGIWERGRPQPVHERKLSNANIGSLPKLTMYIAVHPVHGTVVHWLFHGAKHGGAAATKDQEGKMHEGCKFWYHGLPTEDHRNLVAANYYNNPKGLIKASDSIKQRLAKPFDAAASISGDLFLVRSILSAA